MPNVFTACLSFRDCDVVNLVVPIASVLGDAKKLSIDQTLPIAPNDVRCKSAGVVISAFDFVLSITKSRG